MSVANDTERIAALPVCVLGKDSEHMAAVRAGSAPNGYWNVGNGQVNVNLNDVDNSNDILGSRSPVRDSYFVLFNHPPNIRPTSASWDCSCIIRVSLAMPSSRYSRNLKRSSSSSLWARSR